jgi:polyphosphate kinase
LEDLLAANLDQLFPGNDVIASYPFHVIRDSDIEIDDDEDQTRDLLLAMEEHLSQRTFGSVVMLLVDRTMPDEARRWLTEQLHGSERDVYIVDGPLHLESLFEIASIDRPDLKEPVFTPAPLGRLPEPTSPEAEAFNWGTIDLFAAIRERDVLLHHPYQSFGAVLDFLRTAALDRHVVAMKQTLYRIGKDSPLIPVLVEARDEDTQVAVLMEVKARFDEENNIAWAHELEHNGVHVAYGLAGLKTHCKMMLVVRREEDGLKRYVHLSTGNYNATTARTYEDIGLLTANDEIASDVSELFNVITGFSRQDQYRKLWVAPFGLREKFIELIAREVDIHRRTGTGRLLFKLNSLVDREIIRALYAASQAGVEIDLIVRGICSLRPGVPGWSETIRVRSIVGRFLEHSRIYYFGNGGDDEVYLSSADLMERNLDRRIEVVFPIEDDANKAHLRDVVLPAYLRDTVNARILRPDGVYVPVPESSTSPPYNIHAEFQRQYQLPSN